MCRALFLMGLYAEIEALKINSPLLFWIGFGWCAAALFVNFMWELDTNVKEDK